MTAKFLTNFFLMEKSTSLADKAYANKEKKDNGDK